MQLKTIQSNMTELTLTNGDKVLFSYQTPVACLVSGRFYKTDKKWSITTSKHIGKWANAFWNVSFSQWENKPQEYFDNLVKGV